MEHARHDDKEAEDENLQDQTAEDNMLAQVDIALLLGLGEHSAARALHEEAHDVAGDKDARDPLRADQRVRFGAAAPHDARQDHVDGGGEEDGREQDQQRLADVGPDGRRVGMRSDAADVADCFDWLHVSNWRFGMGDDGDAQMAPTTKGMQNQVRDLMRRTM